MRYIRPHGDIDNMNAVAILSQYSVSEIVEFQDRIGRAIVDMAEQGHFPSYKDLARHIGMPKLVVAKLIESQPALYDLLQLSKVAKVSEVEARLAQLAMGALGTWVENSRGGQTWFPGMDNTEVKAAQLLLEAHDPRHSKRNVVLTMDNPSVPVGNEGLERAVTAMETLSKRLLQMGAK